MNLYRVINEDKSGNPVYVDENRILYNSIYNFKESMPTNKKIADLFELLTEECLEIHRKIFHGDQKFEDGHRPIKHCCSKENKKLKCNTLIDKHTGGTQMQRQKRKEYTDIESFGNRTKLQEIKIKRRYTVLQGGRKINQGENNQQK